VFPAYNEELNIGETLTRALRTIPSFADDWEVIVVDDGSRDRTAEIVKTFSGRHPNVRCISHPTNQGYGAALKSGITNASKDLVFFCDSDLQFDIAEIRVLLEWIDRYDIVIGFRVNRKDPLYRRINAFGWNMLVRMLLKLKVRDIDCAFKLFRRKVFDSIKIDAVGAMVNTDILAQAVQQRFMIKEVPVNHYPRMLGEQTGAKVAVILKAMRELFRLYKKLRITAAREAPGTQRQGKI
jgi:glycosyltransferase involved in cell wall biosynthesis